MIRLATASRPTNKARGEPEWTAKRDEAQIVEHNGIIIYANPCAKRLLGWKKDGDLRGTKAIDRVHPDDRRYAVDRIDKGPSRANPCIPVRINPLRGPHFAAYIQSEPFVYDGKRCTLVSFVSLDHYQPRLTVVGSNRVHEYTKRTTSLQGVIWQTALQINKQNKNN